MTQELMNGQQRRPKRNEHTPNMDFVDRYWYDHALESLDKGDAEGFVAGAYSTDRMIDLVAANFSLLKRRSMYEEALFHAYTGCKKNHSAWRLSELRFLFAECDREKLRNSGDALPGVGPFEVYRGVCGHGVWRHVKGLSWTSSLDVACAFADFDGTKESDPGVYRAVLSEEDLYFYTDHREEQEFVGIPRTYRRIPLGWDEIHKRATKFKQARQRVWIQQVKASTDVARISKGNGLNGCS